MKAVQVKKPGILAKDLAVSKVAKPKISSKEILVKNTFAGLNFIDTYFRSGLYPKPAPFILGSEGVGVIESVGEEVDFSVFRSDAITKPSDLIGKRVAYLGNETYAEYTAVNPNTAFLLPDGIDDGIACASVIQGITGQYLTHSVATLDASKTVLIHACAGGTGQLACQMAKALGATVIGTCSTKKVEQVKELTHGSVDHVIDYTTLDVVDEVRKLFPEGVDLVLDGVGKATYESSLKCAKKRGVVCLFGNASGVVPPLNPLSLEGSIYLTRASMFDYIAQPGEFGERVDSVMKMILAGKLKFNVRKVFNLKDAGKAHEYIENGDTVGKVLIKI